MKRQPPDVPPNERHYDHQPVYAGSANVFAGCACGSVSDGYDKASAIDEANDRGLILKEAALLSDDIGEKHFDEVLDPKSMVEYGVRGS